MQPVVRGRSSSGLKSGKMSFMEVTAGCISIRRHSLNALATAVWKSLKEAYSKLSVIANEDPQKKRVFFESLLRANQALGISSIRARVCHAEEDQYKDEAPILEGQRIVYVNTPSWLQWRTAASTFL